MLMMNFLYKIVKMKSLNLKNYTVILMILHPAINLFFIEINFYKYTEKTLIFLTKTKHYQLKEKQ